MNKLNDAKVIAELLGQTEQWVRLRANIHKNLIQGFKQAFASREQSEVFHSWTVGHLILIARLPAKCQKDILNNIKSYYWQWNNVSISDLNNRISNTLHLLSKAKWNLDDETLYPKAGSCTNCRMRSGTEPLLWFGAVSDQNKLKDRCLDLNCWRQKTKLYLQQRAKQLSAKHDDLAYISKEHLSRDEKQQLSETFGRVLDMDDIQKSTKGSKGTMPALIVHGNGTGDIMYVKQREFARPGGTGARAKGHVTPLKERRAMLKNKRWAQVLLDLREKVEAAKIESVVYKDRYTAVMALVAIYGNESTGIAAMYEQKEIEKIIAEKEKNPTAAYSMALTLLWESFKPTLDRILTYQGPVTQTTKHIIEQARWIAKLIQVDIDEVFKDVSQKKGFTEPKSWASLNPDGTPKTKAAKKTKKAMKVTKVKKTSKKKAS